ncbi:MAG: flagellar basal body P-ring protein FlgI [Gammaproteobacteria bacterium]|nr:flagellar basal body P-ring protein FlgI [Gammaproteobacteria bacterium]
MRPDRKNSHLPRWFSLLVVVLMSMTAQADRVKDLASVAGVRNNQLTGYGIVVGLAGTGDQTSQTPFTVQSIVNMLTQFGITVPPGTNMQLKNVAAVSIYATLPPFSKPGQMIDVTVASIGNAKSIRGGSLLMAPLRGADGNVYAMAQGNLIVGGFGAEGNDGSRVTVNIPSTGRIPNGATVERTVASDFHTRESIVLNLHSPDFTTSNRLATLINETLGAGTALAVDAVSVSIRPPADPMNRTSFLAHLENLEIVPGSASARVIINSRTGTVVIGSNVRVSAAAVSHGSLVVTISEQPFASQPAAPFSNAGETVVLPNSSVTIEEEESSMFLFEPGASLNEIVQAVNRVGAAPGDLVAILEALKQAGALRAELIVI